MKEVHSKVERAIKHILDIHYQNTFVPPEDRGLTLGQLMRRELAAFGPRKKKKKK